MRSLHGVFISRGIPRFANAARAGHGRGPYAVRCIFGIRPDLQVHLFYKSQFYNHTLKLFCTPVRIPNERNAGKEAMGFEHIGGAV